VHWGATSKNVIDTATALQLKASYQVVLGQLDEVEADARRAWPRATATR
jgi:adenylosuccinate lyase